MAKNKKWILAAVAVLAVVLCCWAAWSKWASTTRIGLVNFQNYQTASLVKSNEDNFIEYEEIPLDRLDRLGRYDLVLGFGMGLKITEEQRAQILAAADEGTQTARGLRARVVERVGARAADLDARIADVEIERDALAGLELRFQAQVVTAVIRADHNRLVVETRIGGVPLELVAAARNREVVVELLARTAEKPSADGPVRSV